MSSARAGYCGGLTDDMPARQCVQFVRGVRSLDACVAKCADCPGCGYVTFSAEKDDCSLYEECDLDQLSQGRGGYRSVRVISMSHERAISINRTVAWAASSPAAALWLQSRQAGSCAKSDGARRGCNTGQWGWWALAEYERGSWIDATRACLARCAGCARCRFVTISIDAARCEWVHACDSDLVQHRRGGHYGVTWSGPVPWRWGHGAWLAMRATREADEADATKEAPELSSEAPTGVHSSGAHGSGAHGSSQLVSMGRPKYEAYGSLVLLDVAAGYCDVTNAGASDCTRGTSGAFELPDEACESMTLAARSCLAFCATCANCKYISFSPEHADCSWFSTCDTRRLKTAVGYFATGRVVTMRGGGTWQEGAAAGARAATARLRKLPLPCGFHRDCARNYTLADINASASTWAPANTPDADFEAKRRAAIRACHADFEHHSTDAVVATGGWCLKGKATHVELPLNQSYVFPPAHFEADEGIVRELLALSRASRAAGGTGSINDFGAGVGQYGHALRSIEPGFPWRGWDGAGNVEAYTHGFVKWFDLAMPLRLPRAEWVFSLEVGEHVPAASESMVIRNLHAHNCRGIILSWARLHQKGVSHINNHRRAYIREVFQGLGYTVNQTLLATLRHSYHRGYFQYWVRNNVMAFQRVQPLSAEACSGASGPA